MNEQQQVQAALHVKAMEENLPALLKYAKLNAVIQREKYLALIENGFSEQQALELCK